MSTIVRENIYQMLQNEPVKNTKIFKAKVIPYCVKDGQLFFLLSREQINSKTEITANDKFNMLGGSCNEDETIIQTASRELSEETINIFSNDIEQMKRVPRQNVIRTEKYHKGTIYIFFFPTKLAMMNQVVRHFKMRKEVIGKVYDDAPLSKKNYEMIDSLISIGKEKINKRNVKCFNEIAEIAWFSENDILNSDNVNVFLRTKLRHFKDAQTGRMYGFDEFGAVLKDNWRKFHGVGGV